MSSRAMKEDVFTLKALESKGYDIDSLIKMDDDELDKLPISNRLIKSFKLYKLRGCKTLSEIENEIVELMLSDNTSTISDEAIKLYKEQSDNEKIKFIDELANITKSENTEDDTVEIVRTIANKDDVAIIKEALAKKECKTFASYIKHLKSEVPDAILTSVDGSTLNDLINKRIAEIKDNSKNAK